jgi:zinc protease
MSTGSMPHRTATPPALGAERPVQWPRRTVRTFSNGLQVVLAEIHNFPKMSAELFFRSGNSVVAGSTPGLADMTATVVRTGTAGRSSRQIEEGLRGMGASLGTSAGADTSAISISGLAEFSEGLLAMIADLARNASFPTEEFERERRQRFEELRVSRTTPSFLSSERLRRVLFGAHPYSVIAPTEAQVQAYERGQLEAFYRAHYAPANALLVIVGDFEAAEMLEKAARIFESWKAPSPAAREFPAPPELRGRHVHLVHIPGAVQAEILLGNLSITRRNPDWHRLTLANAIFGGAFNSRLIMNIREQKGYTYSPRSTTHTLRQHGYFSVHAAVRNDVVAATLTETCYELDRMRALPVGQEELEDAASYVSGAFSLGVATQDGILGQFSSVYLDALPEDYLEKYRDRIRALTAADVQQAARRYFESQNAQIVVAGDRAQIEEQAALFGDLTVWDAHGNRL